MSLMTTSVVKLAVTGLQPGLHQLEFSEDVN